MSQRTMRMGVLRPRPQSLGKVVHDGGLRQPDEGARLQGEARGRPGPMRATGGSWRQEIPLVGPGGERVHLGRTLLSHGVASLPPMFVDEATPALEVTLPVPRARPRIVRVEPAGVDRAVMSIAGRRPGAAAAVA